MNDFTEDKLLNIKDDKTCYADNNISTSVKDESKNPPWTDDQKRAIGLLGDTLDNNLTLVSASAGSGKTTVMIERVIQLVKKGVPLDKIAISTFTKASAADMRAKLYKKLAERILKIDEKTDKQDEKKEKQLYEKAIKVLPKAQVSTLHSFCQQLIKTYFYVPDIDPDFEILSDAESAIMLQAAIKSTIEQMYDSGDECFLNLYEVLLKNRKTTKLENLLKKIYNFASAQENFDEFFNKSNQYMAHEFYIDEIKKLTNNSVETKSKGKIFYDPILSADYVKTVTTAVYSIKEIYSASKKKKAALDYSDLEHLGYEILCDAEANKAIAQSYHYLFVDEFQDINPLQSAIINKINAKKFFVGDVKQSIYGFRMCQPKIFSDLIDDVCINGGKDTSVIKLNKNFRSSGGILRFANNVFAGIMTKDFGGVDYGKDAMFETKATDVDVKNDVKAYIVTGGSEKIQPRMEVYSVKNHNYDADGQDISLKQAEINIVANRIFEIIETKKVCEKLHGKTFFRDARYGDIAILLRARNNDFKDMLLEKLNSLDIPVFFEDDIPSSEIREVNDLINYLRLIDNSSDDMMLAGVMLSFFGGFDENDLSQIRQNDRYSLFYESVQSYADSVSANDNNINPDLLQRVKAFLIRLETYSNISKAVGASELLGRITSDSRYFKYLFSLPNGEMKAKQVSAFLDMAEKNVYQNSLKNFINYIDADMPKIAVRQSGDAVRLMTIHASKGLEFPFVILPDLCHGFNLKDLKDACIMDSDGLSLKYWDTDKREECYTSKYELTSLKTKKSLIEEEMRLLYVALTRAQCGITLTARKKELKNSKDRLDANSFFDWLHPYICDKNDKFADILDISECACRRDESKTKAAYSSSGENADLYNKIMDYMEFSYKRESIPVKLTATKLSSMAEEESGALTDDDDTTLEKRQYADFADGERGTDVGTAYHKIMELYNLNASDAEKEFSRVAEIVPTQAAMCKKGKLIAAFNKVVEVTKGKEFYRELPFITSLPVYKTESGNMKNVLVQGVIDLLILNGDGTADIVDYKTGDISLHTAKYRRQLEIYAKATEKILNIKITKKLVFSFEIGDFVDFS